MGTNSRRPPFHAEHIGSLLRPKRLLEARQQWREGTLPKSELRAVEDQCILDAVAMQEQAGLKGVTDGDFRRDDWLMDFLLGLDGFRDSGKSFEVPFSGDVVYRAPIMRVVDKIAWPSEESTVADFEFLAAQTRGTAKLCIPAPAMAYTMIAPQRLRTEIYSDFDELWSDLGRAYRDSIAAYAAAGCTYLQIDDVNSVSLTDPGRQAFWRSLGREPEELLRALIEINNAALASRPSTMTVVVHLCRGNFKSQWAGEGGYEAVAEQYFSTLDVDGFLLEYDDERSGGFEPLRFVPRDKPVVLGIVTSKRPELENQDALKRRIDEASRYVSIDNLGISPQCGFASTHHGNLLTEDDERRKLQYIVEVAEDVWGDR